MDLQLEIKIELAGQVKGRSFFIAIPKELTRPAQIEEFKKRALSELFSVQIQFMQLVDQDGQVFYVNKKQIQTVTAEVSNV